MCGIAGIIHSDGKSVDQTVLKKMVRTLIHRGPDDEGYFVSGSVGLGMRRLSIIDLESGKQPIYNEDKSIVTVCNGEIYNFTELKKKLERKGHRFYTNSDTEVIVHAYEEYDTDFVKYLNGMFAIAIWDQNKQQILLIRDRLGIKPLYYGHEKGSFVFGSEIKALIASNVFKNEINLEALQAYFALRYVPAPLSIFKNIFKVQAGSFVKFDKRRIVEEKSYWDVSYDKIEKIPESISRKQFIDLFDNAVGLRLLSDVPLGAFLSGGIDSSAIVTSMSQRGYSNTKTFSIGFEEKHFDERQFSKEVSTLAKSEHYEFVAKADLMEFMEDYVFYFDEPFADPAAIPTFLLSKKTREHVTVALSGDGADEIFAGYQRYWSERLADYFSIIPSNIRRKFVNPLIKKLSNRIPPEWHIRTAADHAAKKSALSLLSPDKRYLAHFDVFSGYENSEIWVSDILNEMNAHGPHDRLSPWMNKGAKWSKLNQRLYTDIKTWLPEQMLTKIDRMSMAVSLEVRVPFLDHRIVEFSAKLLPEYKMGWLCLKKFLRNAMIGRLPDRIITRNKHGFQVPLDKWFRTDLCQMIKEVLSEKNIYDQGLLKPQFVNKLVNEHIEGKRNHGDKLFSLLVFALWYKRWVG